MDDKKQILVEHILFDALRTFHDSDDKEKRELYAKEFFDEFCKKYQVDPVETYFILQKMFEQKRSTSIFKYEHYDGDKLKGILFKEDKEDLSSKKPEKEPDER